MTLGKAMMGAAEKIVGREIRRKTIRPERRLMASASIRDAILHSAPGCSPAEHVEYIAAAVQRLKRESQTETSA